MMGKTKTKQNKKKKLHGCLKLEKVFYLLQNTAPNSKAIDNVAPLCMPCTAVDWLWLLRKAVVYNHIEPHEITRTVNGLKMPI